MADTIPNIPIVAGEWQDIYALTGIAVGTLIDVENTGVCDIYLAVQATQPPVDHDDYNILKRNGPRLENNSGDSGAWAFCAHTDGELNVSVGQENGFHRPLSSSSSTLSSSRITDRQNRSVKISQKGELLTGSNNDDVDINFQYTIRSAETRTTTSGTGVVSHPGANGSYAEISPGTGVGSAELVSLSPVRYRAGHEVYCEQSTIYREPEENLNQWFGFLNGNDRWLMGYQGLVFGLMFREGGNDTFIPQSSFNVDKLDGTGPSGYDMNQQAINVNRLSFVWHGGLPLTLEIQINQQYYPVHTLNFANTITETHLENPHLPIGALIERTSGTGTDQAMRTGSWRGGSIASAGDEGSDDWTSHTVLDASLSNNVRTNIMTMVNPMLWQGKQNHIVYELGVIAFESDANKTVAVYATKGATITGGGAETFIDEGNYALKYIDGGTVTGGSRGPATVIKAGGDRRSDVRGTGIFIYPGETFTLEVDPGGPVNGEFSIASRFIHQG